MENGGQASPRRHIIGHSHEEPQNLVKQQHGQLFHIPCYSSNGLASSERTTRKPICRVKRTAFRQAIAAIDNTNHHGNTNIDMQSTDAAVQTRLDGIMLTADASASNCRHVTGEGPITFLGLSIQYLFTFVGKQESHTLRLQPNQVSCTRGTRR